MERQCVPRQLLGTSAGRLAYIRRIMPRRCWCRESGSEIVGRRGDTACFPKTSLLRRALPVPVWEKKQNCNEHLCEILSFVIKKYFYIFLFQLVSNLGGCLNPFFHLFHLIQWLQMLFRWKCLNFSTFSTHQFYRQTKLIKSQTRDLKK